MAEASNIL